MVPVMGNPRPHRVELRKEKGGMLPLRQGFFSQKEQVLGMHKLSSGEELGRQRLMVLERGVPCYKLQKLDLRI